MRALYKELLRVGAKFDRYPALKAALVHPSCEWMESMASEEEDRLSELQTKLHRLAMTLDAKPAAGTAGGGVAGKQKTPDNDASVSATGSSAPMTSNGKVQPSSGAVFDRAEAAAASMLSEKQQQPDLSSSSDKPTTEPGIKVDWRAAKRLWDAIEGLSSPPAVNRPPATIQSSSATNAPVAPSNPLVRITPDLESRFIQATRGPGTPLSQKLFWTWMDRFFRRPAIAVTEGNRVPNPSSIMKKHKFRRSKVTTSEGQQATQALIPLVGSSSTTSPTSHPGKSSKSPSVVPFYYLPSRSLRESVRKEFRAFTKRPSKAQYTQMLGAGFEVLKYLNTTQQEVFRRDDDEEESSANANVLDPAQSLSARDIMFEEESIQLDPAIGFSPWETLPQSQTQHNQQQLANVDDLNSTAAATTESRDADGRRDKEQWEVDLDAMQADIKQEKQSAAATTPTQLSSAIESETASSPPAASSSVDIPKTSSSAACSTPHAPVDPSTLVPPHWSMRPSSVLREGSFLVSHPALSEADFHQSVLLITKYVPETPGDPHTGQGYHEGLVEGVLLNRPLDPQQAKEMEEEIKRAEKQYYEQTGDKDPNDDATAISKSMKKSKKDTKKQQAVEAAADASAPSPSSQTEYAPIYDYVTLARRMPGAIMSGGPVLEDDEVEPIILHRRKEWAAVDTNVVVQSLKRGLRRSPIIQTPIIPVVPSTATSTGSTTATSTSSTSTSPHFDVAPPSPVYVGKLAEWGNFLSILSHPDLTDEEATWQAAEALHDNTHAIAAATALTAPSTLRASSSRSRASGPMHATSIPRPSGMVSRKSHAHPSAAVSRHRSRSGSAAVTTEHKLPWPASVLARGSNALKWMRNDNPHMQNETSVTVTSEPSQPTSSAASAATSSSSSPSSPVSPHVTPFWDLLIFYGRTRWSPAQLREEIRQGVWILMEGNSTHVFTQRAMPTQPPSSNPAAMNNQDDIEKQSAKNHVYEQDQDHKRDEDDDGVQFSINIDEGNDEDDGGLLFDERKHDEENRAALGMNIEIDEGNDEDEEEHPEARDNTNDAAVTVDESQSDVTDSVAAAPTEAPGPKPAASFDTMLVACSSPAISQSVYASLAAKNTSNASTSSTSSPSSLTPSSSTTSAPDSLPPVSFPHTRLWSHALFQLGREGRHWAHLPSVPFDAMEEDEDDDEDDDEIEWIDDDEEDDEQPRDFSEDDEDDDDEGK